MVACEEMDGMESKGIPLDAPLFEGDPGRGTEYWNCESIAAFFTLKSPVSALLPEGLTPAGDPPLGAVMFARYGGSVVGPYLEQLSLIQVQTEAGELGVYVPYIYVTTDVAMAGGREALGYPKKIAGIDITRWSDIVQGTLERPLGNRLITLTMRPNDRLDPGLEELLGQSPMSMFTVRHVPGLDGRGGLTQLIKSTVEIYTHKDARGKEIVFAGPASLTYNTPNVIDPVHNLEVGQVIAGVYREFDAVLRPAAVLRESFVPSFTKVAVG